VFKFADDPLRFSRSSISSRGNKTGSWRYLKPVFVKRTAPCSAACPAGADIPAIAHLTSHGRYKEALDTILRENPFAATCGHVCFHPCEHACNRSQLDDPLAINAIERHVGNWAIREKYQPVEKSPPNGRRVAVIGSGPSGLAAAYFLSRLGYGCDIYESEKEPGGLLRWGIPAYRLPLDVLTFEIDRIRKRGINILCDQKISESFLNTAAKQYQAVFVGCGHGRPVQMQIPGEDLALDGLAFLKDVRKGHPSPLKGVSAVIGGGNSAIDISRSLVRMGSAPIVLYRRRIQDMPAYDPEIKLAQQEGVRIKELTLPLAIERHSDSLLVRLQKMRVDDRKTDHGRSRVTPIVGKQETLQVARVFRAIGAVPEASWQQPGIGSESVLELSHCTFTADGLPIVHGGDLVNQTLSVSDAIASGKQAAMAIDIYFHKGWASIEAELAACRVAQGPALSMETYCDPEKSSRRHPQIVDFKDINTAYFPTSERIALDLDHPVDRRISFSDYRPDTSSGALSQEAARCFNCGMCNACDNCRLFCPETAVCEGEARSIDMDYCKGCGICVEECPRSAMVLEEEGHETGS